jgi:ABC-type ATPase involved in cell division
MYLIELSEYCLDPIGTGKGLNNSYFALSRGDACSLQTDSTDDAHIFLKALAMLVRSISGTYRFTGNIIDFSDYRKLLPFKKKIGYIGQDSAMLSNRTVRENLLLRRFYFENSLSISLDENILKFLKMFDLEDKLDLRPGELRLVDLQTAIAIRELTKSFDVLLLDRPELYFELKGFYIFNEILENTLEAGHAVVFFSRDPNFIETFSNRKILIAGGTLTKVPL